MPIPTGANLRSRLRAVAETVPDVPVRRVMVGVHMTAVASRTVGCAYTWRDPVGAAHLCTEVRNAGRLRGTSARELSRSLESGSFLETSVGMAALNSLINVARPEWTRGDILAWMRQKFAGATVGMIGHFPFADEVRKWAGAFRVIEKKPVEDDLSEEAGPAWLKRCDAVIITGVTLLNDTLPGILQNCSQAWKLMLGPTVPLHPLLLEMGVNALAGIVCTQEEDYWQSIEEGAIVPRFRGTEACVLADRSLELPTGDFRVRLQKDLDRTKGVNSMQTTQETQK
ncbi:MAG: hypothetical protein BWY66_00107 [bacterium ADurb.Bin374]|nr:MAG: hypothetical protein BWY66_00107 [bacterium ADurb.Bin374]